MYGCMESLLEFWLLQRLLGLILTHILSYPLGLSSLQFFSNLSNPDQPFRHSSSFGCYKILCFQFNVLKPAYVVIPSRVGW